MKNNTKLIRIVGAFALIAQFVAVIVTASVFSKEKKGIAYTVLAVASSLGGLYGAYLVFKEFVEPKLAEKISDFTLDDEYDDFDVYADLMGEPEAAESITDDPAE